MTKGVLQRRQRTKSAGPCHPLRRKKRPFTGAHFTDWASGLTLDNGKPWLVEPFQAAFLRDVSAGVPECWLIVPENAPRRRLSPTTDDQGGRGSQKEERPTRDSQQARCRSHLHHLLLSLMRIARAVPTSPTGVVSISSTPPPPISGGERPRRSGPAHRSARTAQGG